MSLTSDDLADIKQLMEAVIRAQDDRIDKKFADIDNRFAGIDDRFEEIDEKLNTIMDAVGVNLNEHTEQLDDHEARIVRLEKQPA